MLTDVHFTTERLNKFQAKISKIPTERGCLEWTAYHNRRGYGYFQVNGRPQPAYRIAWILENGPIPSYLVVRHFLCSNPLCCNVAHLRLGTHSDNAQDMVRDGHWHNGPDAPDPYVRPIGPTETERFFAKVSKTPTAEGCLDWTATRIRTGYGHFKVNGRLILAHRYAWELVNGPIPDGLLCLHKCDRRSCVNPEHLFLGSKLDNSRDMYAKGRSKHTPQRGEDSALSKLTAAQVLEIRSAKYSDWELADIATLFGVSRPYVSQILDRQRWAHLDSSEDAPMRDRLVKGEQSKKAKLTDAKVLEIRSGKFSNWTQKEIAEHFGVGKTTIACVLRRENWKHLGGSEEIPTQIGQAKGERVNTAKLTESQVLEIRSEKFSGWTQSAIAEHFGVSAGTIAHILSRLVWKHI